MRYHASNQPQSPNVPDDTHMDTLTSQAKHDVTQPQCVPATRAPFFVNFMGLYFKKSKIVALVARTNGGCIASNFAWQVSVSIWVTYVIFGLSGLLEV